MAYIPERGDAVWLDLDPVLGHEQAGRRPSVVLSRSIYNAKTGLALFCPITRKVKGFPYEVTVPEGLAVNGVILADHIKNLDWRQRRAELICALPDELVIETLARLGSMLDLIFPDSDISIVD
jgi:mRNA interferase MazF